MGGIDGEVYTNSLEAWERNYEKGYRYFEADLSRAADGKLVAYHDGLSDKYGLSGGFTSDEFIDSTFDGKYTPLDVERIASLMKQKDDWYLVTDVKNGFLRSLIQLRFVLKQNDVDYRNRVIPQIYNVIYNLRVARRLGFGGVIFTLYRSSLTNEEVVNTVEKHDTIKAVTMSEDRYSAEFVAKLNDIGVPVYVHTINEEDEICDYLDAGVQGVYTDFGYGANC